MTERHLRVDGLRIRVRVRGAAAGPPLVLLNGIGANVAQWSPLLAMFGDHPVIAFDAPGTGESQTPPLPLSVGGLARLVARLLDALGVGHADLLGYSFGGCVAQQFAVQYPARVRRLALVATTCGWGGVPGQPLALLAVSTPLRYYSKSAYAAWTSIVEGGDGDDGAHAHDRDARMSAPPSLLGYGWQLAAAASWSSLGSLHRIAAPTLVVAGTRDRLVPIANAELLARRIRDARLLVADGDGHGLLFAPNSPAVAMLPAFFAGSDHAASAAWGAAVAVGRRRAS